MSFVSSMFGMESVGNGDMSHVYRGIWIGGHTALQSGLLTQNGIRAVVNTAIELIDGGFPAVNWGDLQRSGIIVQHVPLDDSPMQPLVPLSGATQSALQFIHDCVNSGRPVLVNCAMGISRSPSLVIAYLIAYQNMSYEEAYAVVAGGRLQANPNPGFQQQLRQLALASGRGGYSIPPTMAAGFGPQFPMYALSDANWEYYRPSLPHRGMKSFFSRLRNF